jgi:hypothetical protein
MGGITLQRDSLKAVILRPAFGRRTSRNDLDLIALSRLLHQDFWPKSQDATSKSEASLEILRQRKAQDDSASAVLVALNARHLKRENRRRS